MRTSSNLLLLIIIILLLVNLFQAKTRIPQIDTGKLESIQKELDLLYKSNLQLNQQITGIDSNLQKVSSSIVLVQSNLQKIRINTKSRIDSVDRYSYSDLGKFFSDRYKK
jgi:septal ring factor EnvC (AmiA/AmiB activator)